MLADFFVGKSGSSIADIIVGVEFVADIIVGIRIGLLEPLGSSPTTGTVTADRLKIV